MNSLLKKEFSSVARVNASLVGQRRKPAIGKVVLVPIDRELLQIVIRRPYGGTALAIQVTGVFSGFRWTKDIKGDFGWRGKRE